MILFARSKRYIYFELPNNTILGCQLNHSEDFIGNNFFHLPFVNNQEEAQSLLDLRNETQLNSFEAQSH